MPPPKRPSSRTAATTASKRGSSTGGRSAKPKQGSGSTAAPSRASSAAASRNAASGAGGSRKAASGAQAGASGARRTGTRSPATKQTAITRKRGTTTSGANAGTRRTATTAANAGTRRTATTAAIGARSAASRGGRSATGTGARGGAARGGPAGEGIVSLAEQVVLGSAKPRDLILLTRERIQEALDDAAERGRVTRKDANELVSELVRRGRAQGDDLIAELETLVGRRGEQLRSATRRARLTEPVERLVRGADRVRRSAGGGSSFPITGYDRLSATQVRGRVKELSKPELRKVLTYERNHANRRTVVAALEKAIR